MTSQVLGHAIDKIDQLLDGRQGLSARVARILNDLNTIERLLVKKGDSVQHLMHLEDLIIKAKTVIGA